MHILFRLVCVSLLFCPSLSCYQCFVDVQDSLRLCWGHVLTQYNVRNVDTCFRKLDRIFNTNERVIEAGRVGKKFFLLFNFNNELQIVELYWCMFSSSPR